MERQLLTAAIVLMAASAVAQENQLTVDAQLRTRAEHNDGAITPSQGDEQSANFVNERARLTVDFQRDNLELKAGIQHTGVWGQDDIKQPGGGRATLNEAWAKMTFADNYFVQLGRMQLAYDDERLLGTLDWNVNGNWHDALRMGYKDYHNQLHLILAMNQTAENNRGDYYSMAVTTVHMPYKNLQALWYHYKSEMLPLGVSLLAINMGREVGAQGHGRTYYMQTVGADVTFSPMQWRLHAAGYYQMGKNASARNVSAMMATASAQYAFNPAYSVNMGYDFLSGNNGSATSTAFDPLFGTHHKFYGSMDYFTGLLSYGLHDIHGGIGAKFTDRFSAQLDYHYFLTAQVATGIGGDFGRSLGHEADLQLTYKVARDVTLTAGYSAMLATEALDWVKTFRDTRILGTHKDFQNWGYLQVNVNPRILFTKW
ncbi:MAG: alginate export family protein [Prevotella sp.]|nr:alginate export family protein [Prevotella sp.]